MIARPAAASLVLVLVLMSCADAPPGPAAGGIPHATGGQDVLVRVDLEGGFTPAEWTYTGLPSFSLFGDGTIVLPGAQIEIYPGPALPAISARSVDEEGIQAILEEVLRSIDGVPDEMLDMASVGMADVPTTVITVRAGDVDRTIRAYGLIEFPEPPATMPADEFRARQRLQDLVTRLGLADTWLPEGSIGLETSYEGSGALILVNEYRQADLPQDPIAWPLGVALGGFGDVAGGPGTFRCGVVEGGDWTALRQAASRANELTPWTQAGTRFSIMFRPLLPDESGCDRGAPPAA